MRDIRTNKQAENNMQPNYFQREGQNQYNRTKARGNNNEQRIT